MKQHRACPTCLAAWSREEYEPGDRVIVTCTNGHRFLVRELRPWNSYVTLTAIDR